MRCAAAKWPGFLSLLLLLLVAERLPAQGLQPRLCEQATPPKTKEKFKLYLLVGQSNMAGRGAVEAQDTVPNRRVLRLNKEGAWEIAKDPVHFDKAAAGVGPGLTFGKTLAALDTSVVIGLIPCAVGGSGINVWQPGAFYAATNTNPYDDAIRRAKAAMQSGTLAGIIWHQGESDSKPDLSSAYGKNLTELIARFRRDLQSPDVPFVAGQLPEFQFVQTDSIGKQHVNADAIRVNQAVAQLKKTVPHYDYVTAEGTRDRGDRLHFDAVSARLMGRRYALAIKALQQKNAKARSRVRAK
ncbi:sialate O-acetylesterase [Hymenobacter jejuensis]|uniref:Sialate O-acetylesterase n=2 Tax=Hymenobacter jejuensis TaxID=2502781 RepID=A0A5B7ZXJ9_9BACT|nr:sialate O-acetylesterase [Hymenobacter jejuensis]